MRRNIRFTTLLLGSGMAILAQNAGPVDDGAIRRAVTKPIALMQTTSLAWFEKRTCSTCHQQTLPMIALDLARRRGVTLDQGMLEQTMHKTFDFLSDLDRAVQGAYIGESVNSGYRLAVAVPLGIPQSLSTGAYARLIARRQMADGHWENDDERPPQASSGFSTTAYSVQTLQHFLPETMGSELRARVERASGWLKRTPISNTEDRVYQLFGLGWAGSSPEALAKNRDALLALQQPDGGWAQLPGLPSDAYSTGETLVALHQAAGVAVTSAAYRKGLEYLLGTQEPDGTWFVVSRLHPPAPVSPPYLETGWPHGHDQFISSMGTSWAVSALLLALPESPIVPPLSWTSTMPLAAPQWAATVLFGGVNGLRKLLDSGWNPNSSTRNGTTALMMAAPDFEKTALLIARAAAVQTKANTRFTSLMVAASHHATDSVHLLLAHHAEAQPPKGEPALFGATPLFLAVYSGDVHAMEELHAKGADINSKALMFGTDTDSTMSIAVERGEPAMIEALMRRGASIDGPDPDNGLPFLSTAIFKNDIDTARLLIRKGADVNYKDALGFTPLHWAANVDFGDTAVLELLLKAGANPAARNGDGLTPLQLAMKYKHSQHQKMLESAETRMKK
jgi:ankyrin repeat protein